MAAFPILTLSAPAAADEGNSGNTLFRFVVTRSGLTTSACSCSWALTGTVATDDLAAGQATSGTVSFAAGAAAIGALPHFGHATALASMDAPQN